jgi:NADPH-dependent 2,4-dienoyl-CoA reductase/sulfur reductase-like enzyme
MEDARRILKIARKRQTVVVVGGGITALELVEGFRARGLNVHYFLRGDRYWSNVLDETESKIVEHRLIEEGVHLHYHTELAEIIGKHNKVNGVLTVDGVKIPCDIVGVAIGIKPRTELADISGIKIDRGISVDETLKTNFDDIYAAGDVAQVYDPIVGKAILDSLWGPACRQGYAAGLNMAGKSKLFGSGVQRNPVGWIDYNDHGAIGGREEDADVVGIVRR